MQSGNSVYCPAIGRPSELTSHILPSHADIMNYYLLVRNDYKVKLNNVHPSVSQISDKVAERIEEIRCKASLIILRQCIVQMIRKHYKKYDNIEENYSNKTLSVST